MRAFNTMITFAIEQKRWDVSDQCMAEMKERGLEPDSVTYNLFLLMANRKGDAEEYQRTLDKMKELGYLDDKRTYRTRIRVAKDTGT